MPIDKGFEPYLPTPSLFSQISLLYLMPMCYHYLKWTPLGIKMTDRKPRINVTVDDDMNELLTALSKFEGKPKATLITDILEQMRPHLTDLLHAMELVEQKKDPSKVINRLLVNQQKQFLDNLEVSDD